MYNVNISVDPRAIIEAMDANEREMLLVDIFESYSKDGSLLDIVASRYGVEEILRKLDLGEVEEELNYLKSERA